MTPRDRGLRRPSPPGVPLSGMYAVRGVGVVAGIVQSDRAEEHVPLPRAEPGCEAPRRFGAQRLGGSASLDLPRAEGRLQAPGDPRLDLVGAEPAPGPAPQVQLDDPLGPGAAAAVRLEAPGAHDAQLGPPGAQWHSVISL